MEDGAQQMPINPNLLELRDSKRELNRHLRQTLRLTAAKAIDRDQWNTVIERVRDALEIVEEVDLMLKVEEERN
jgi:hypothetical protein